MSVGEGSNSYIIRQIEPTDKINKLKLRSADGALGVFLQRNALEYHQHNVAKTYVVVDGNEAPPQRVRAYITILGPVDKRVDV